MLGTDIGVMVTGDSESGFELGFNTGVDVVGVLGVNVGTVVIGVVMSFWSVDISTFLASLRPESRLRKG